MYSILQAHYDVRRQKDRIGSSDDKEFHPAEIDEVLNHALHIWKENVYAGFNAKGSGFEVTQQRTDDLNTLVVTETLTPSSSSNGIYEFKLSQLSLPYWHLVRLSGNVTKDSCSKSIEVNLVQHDDLSYYLKDSIQGPNFKWNKTVATLRKDNISSVLDSASIYVYTNNKFEVNSLEITYLREPSKVNLGGYTGIDGNLTTQQDFDIPANSVYKVINIAVRELARELKDSAFQLYDQKVQVHD